MIAEIRPTLQTKLSNFAPLRFADGIGSFRLGHKTFFDLQVTELVSAHIQHEPGGGGKRLHVQANAFLVKEDLVQIRKMQGPWIVKSEEGEILAWTGEGTLDEQSTQTFIADQSFMVQYAWDFLRVNEVFVNRMQEDNVEGEISDLARIEGKVEVGKGTRLLPGVFIEGNVKIGRNCKIGPNCYLRGPTSIGNNCHVGNAVEIKASILQDGCSVGHLSYVGDSIIGIKANLGAGTTTSNLRHDGKNHKAMVNGDLIDTGRRKFGTIIADNVHTGINTSIYPGRFICAGGSTLPGGIVRKNVEE